MTAYVDMERLSAKLLRNTYSGMTYLSYWCPGCKTPHSVTVGAREGWTGATWSFNGDAKAPTLAPSVRHFTPAGPYGENEEQVLERTYCHYHIVAGKVNFCNDCTHALNGVQGVELPDFPL